MNNQNARWAPYGLQGGRGDGQPADEPEIIVINERDLRAFIFRVYLSSAILCALSGIPWIILSALHVNVYEDIPVPPFVWLLLSFIILTILSCIRQTPPITLLCWGMVLASVFFITLYGAYYMHLVNAWVLLVSLVAAGALLALLHLYGAKSPEMLLPNLLCTCCVFLLASITMIVLMILFLVIHDLRYMLAFACVFVVLIIFMAPFQARYICGRLRQVPFGETASSANGIYLHFVFLLACMLVFALYYHYVNK
ncbi:uncharacterized protein LOC128261594 [Drosophila gunungcola]|uniref:Uncharacterized protein n=1 Tax=Drosophila gunungcola TaxID=103775 RepID=A0A9Q0BT93_9MUSC|nr:uncharacterized protein LOC128261594 [Drosophila gunungcola]KAI8043777.1 hypothetical protein M5D96_005115 [Drosophila gunungcola]